EREVDGSAHGELAVAEAGPGPPERAGHHDDEGPAGSCHHCRTPRLRPAAATEVAGLAPHDLRRTAAKLCRAAGGELEQIQLLLGHASVQTTERYLGTKQDLVHAPNDGIKLRVAV